VFNNLRSKFLSLQFRIIRRSVITILASFPKDLERAIIFGDALNHFLMSTPLKYLFKFAVPKNIEVKMFDLKFASPLISASFKDDVSSLFQWQLLGIGGITYKTVLKDPSKGNNRPRIQEVRHNGRYGILNSLGLPTKGVKKFKKLINNKKLINFGRPIGISIGGNNVQDYYDVFNEIHSTLENIDFNQFFYELNISCPNTSDGKCLSDNLEGLESLLSKMRAKTSRPIFIKVSPDSSREEIIKICDILEKMSFVAINLGNSKYMTAKSLGLNSDNFSKDGGGLSGETLFDNTLEMVKLVSSKYNFPIIATGGISNLSNVEEVLNAGATIVGMATLLVSDPLKIPQINKELSKND